MYPESIENTINQLEKPPALPLLPTFKKKKKGSLASSYTERRGVCSVHFGN